MKTAPYTDATVATKDTAIVRSPIKVSMHVLGTAHSDVRVMRAATALTDAGFAVTVVDIESKCKLQTEDIHNICMKHVKVSSSFIVTRFRRWAVVKALLLFIHSTLRLLQTPADIYHAHDVTALPACYIAARLRRKPLILEAHELPLSELDGAHRRWLRVLLTSLLSHMISSCVGGIGASPFYTKVLRNQYHVPNVILTRNVPPYQTVAKSDRLRQHLGLSPEVRIALYQGNVQPDRELDRLVRAARFLEPNIVIVMMGKNMGATQARLEALIASEEVADRVKIIPAVPYEELLDWTASADIGLIVYSPHCSQNIKMCLPNKLFEFLMAGLPVLASQLDAVAEVIRTYDVGQIVSSLTPTDIGAAINAMLADHDGLARMRRNALEAAQQEFHWEKERQQLIGLYHKVLVKRHFRNGNHQLT